MKLDEMLRLRRNGIIPPGKGTIGEKVWKICYDLGPGVTTKSVQEIAARDGINPRTTGGYVSGWRSYNGLDVVEVDVVKEIEKTRGLIRSKLNRMEGTMVELRLQIDHLLEKTRDLSSEADE